MGSIISGLIGGLLAAAIGTYISKGTRKTKNKGELKFGISILILALGCSGFVGLAIFAFFNDLDAWENRAELLSIIGIFFGFGIGAIYCLGEYFKVKGNFNKQEIDFNSPWTGRKIEKWSDLVSITSSSFASGYVLKFKNGTKIRISNYLIGHGEILDLLKSKGYKIDGL